MTVKLGETSIKVRKFGKKSLKILDYFAFDRRGNEKYEAQEKKVETNLLTLSHDDLLECMNYCLQQESLSLTLRGNTDHSPLKPVSVPPGGGRSTDPGLGGYRSTIYGLLAGGGGVS